VFETAGTVHAAACDRSSSGACDGDFMTDGRRREASHRSLSARAAS